MSSGSGTPVRIIPVRNLTTDPNQAGTPIERKAAERGATIQAGWYATAYTQDGRPVWTGPVKSDKQSAINAVATWLSLAGWRAHDVMVFEEDR